MFAWRFHLFIAMDGYGHGYLAQWFIHGWTHFLSFFYWLIFQAHFGSHWQGEFIALVFVYSKIFLFFYFVSLFSSPVFMLYCIICLLMYGTTTKVIHFISLYIEVWRQRTSHLFSLLLHPRNLFLVQQSFQHIGQVQHFKTYKHFILTCCTKPLHRAPPILFYWGPPPPPVLHAPSLHRVPPSHGNPIHLCLARSPSRTLQLTVGVVSAAEAVQKTVCGTRWGPVSDKLQVGKSAVTILIATPPQHLLLPL